MGEDGRADGDAVSGGDGSGGSGGGASPGSARTKRRRQQRDGRRRAGAAVSRPEVPDTALSTLSPPNDDGTSGEKQPGQGKWVPNASAQPFWLPNASAKPFVSEGWLPNASAQPFVPEGVANSLSFEELFPMDGYTEPISHEVVDPIEGWYTYDECPYEQIVTAPEASMLQQPIEHPVTTQSQAVIPAPSKHWNYKAALCRHWERGHCALGDACNFAHGSKELRPVQDRGAGISANGSSKAVNPEDVRSELLTLCGAWGALSSKTLDRADILKFRHCSKPRAEDRIYMLRAMKMN